MPDRTPAATLSAAAARLRETASGATPGPWGVESEAGRSVGVYSYSGHSFAASIGDPTADEQAPHDAEWIAMMSPAIAELVAPWMKSAAEDLAAKQYAVKAHPEMHAGWDAIDLCDEPGAVRRLLSLARVILGEAPDTAAENGGDRG